MIIPMTMSRPIFLSYRRSDSASATGRLYDAMRQRFGADTVYMDTSSTAWGEEWPTALENAVAGADVVIVVIGRDWLRASDDWGRRRIDQAGDWVRREIELAVASGKTILPLLVGGATMPPPDAFPPEIAELATRQAFRVDEETWDYQVEAVLDRLAFRIPERIARPGERSRAEPRHEQTIADEFRSIASRFYEASVEDRLVAAEEIAGIAGLLELEDVLAFGGSREASERVGAAIALAAHLRMSEQPREDPRVQSTLRALLNDDRSRVRYRAAEVLRGFPALVPEYRGDLAWRAENDENEYVRRMARNALRRGAQG
jgi:TIR domain